MVVPAPAGPRERGDNPLLTFKQIAAAFGDVPSDRADAVACVPLQGADGGVAVAGQQH